MTESSSRSISLDQIHVSQSTGQIERRKHFDKAAIDELADSIKSVGLINPIVARPVNGHFELVAGERRFLAAAKAGLKVIDVTVRPLTDEQVLEIQLIENLQREGLHELAEAEGYEQLQRLGHAANEIAAKVGKSKGYVYGRMKLLALTAAARKSFYGGALNASTALLLARIPVESLQLQALKEITREDRFNGRMSYRQAFDHVQEHYMLRLDEAGFKTEDEALVPAAGACGRCPKRTGNQPELFGDIKRADVCTDPICFRAKRDASVAQLAAQGASVVQGKDAKKVISHGHLNYDSPFVELTQTTYEDPKHRSAAQLLGRNYEPTLIQDPDSGKVIRVAEKADVAAALKDAGVKPGRAASSTQSSADKKRKFETKYRRDLYEQLRARLPSKFVDDDMRHLAFRFFDEIWNDAQKVVMSLWGWEKADRGDMMKAVKDQLKALDDADVVRFVWDCIFCRELLVTGYSNQPASLLTAAAKKLKINPDKVRALLKAEDDAKRKPKAKVAKKRGKAK